VTACGLAEPFERAGFDFFAGVPCSLIEDLLAALERHPGRPWIAAAREDLAVGLAAGAWLGGRTPAVLMQNSGLGTSLNALASLSLLYGLPALLLVTWRGHDGRDAPEHRLTGAITPRLLDLLGIAVRTLAPGSLERDLDWARRTMEERRAPVALLVPPGALTGAAERESRAAAAASDPGSVATAAAPGQDAGRAPAAAEPYHAPALRPTISRYEAIATVLKALSDELVVAANGYPSREACAAADRSENFYMIGSMGLAAAIGLGVAVARPDRGVVVLDGDGNLLMGLGVLASVATLAPARFVHCVFDNEVYGSTGNQASATRHLRLDRLAAAAGYRTVAAVDGPGALGEALRRARAAPGPHFILVKVTTEEADVPRVPLAPEALRDRFRAAAAAR
jgi:phosphonopyruvate decarboxylase